jgi:hypothetical protein
MKSLLPDKVSVTVEKLNRTLREQREAARERARAELEAARTLAGQIAELRGLIEETLASGVEGRAFLPALRESREAIRQSLDGYAVSRELIAAAEGGAETLAAYVEEAESCLALFDSLIAWLEAPPPAIDPDSLPDASGPAGEAGGFASLEDLTAGGA